MNDKLTQKYEDQGKIAWVAGRSTIDSAHPVWKVLLDATVFTVGAGGADSVTIRIKVVVVLALAQDQYFPIGETQEYAVTIVR